MSEPFDYDEGLGCAYDGADLGSDSGYGRVQKD
jgi:hypothetical protein